MSDLMQVEISVAVFLLVFALLSLWSDRRGY